MKATIASQCSRRARSAGKHSLNVLLEERMLTMMIDVALGDVLPAGFQRSGLRCPARGCMDGEAEARDLARQRGGHPSDGAGQMIVQRHDDGVEARLSGCNGLFASYSVSTVMM